MSKTKYRAVFISDCHMASVGCKSKELLKFLKETECDNLYLIGDIFDLWRLDRTKWDKNQTEVIRRLLKMSKHCNVHYVLGNHDHGMMELLDSFHYPNLEICKETYYHSFGKKYYITHGDKFDFILFSRIGVMISKVGSWGYDTLVSMNEFLARCLRMFGVKRVRLSKFARENFKKAVTYVGEFEGLLSEYAKENHCDGVICGHVHSPIIKKIDGIDYYNCGDWVEHCSAIVEHENGDFELLIFGV